MSTLTTRDNVLVDAQRSPASPAPNVRSAPPSVWRAGFSFARLLASYKSAVLSPATAQEKADWQKNSF